MTRVLTAAAVALAAAALLAGGAAPAAIFLTLKITAPEVVDVHDQFAYTITVTNTSAAGQRLLQMTDTLPDQVSFKSASASRADFKCSNSGKTVTCASQGPLAVRESITFRINVQDNAEGLTSFSKTDNASTSTQKAAGAAKVIVALPDPAVPKTGPAQVMVEDVAAYTITVTNSGQYPARDASLTDALPDQLTNISAPGCSVANGQATCALGDVAPGDTKTFQVAGQAATSGTATDTA